MSPIRVLYHNYSPCLNLPGGGFDRSYWNVAPGYSYVGCAAEQGYATFLYDRLGWGLSDHPDPLEIVQLELQVTIAHELIYYFVLAEFQIIHSRMS